MMLSVSPSASSDPPQERLQHFLTWLIIVVFGFTLLYSAMFVVLRELVLGAAMVVGWGYTGVLLAARSYTRRGLLQMGITLTCAGFLAVAAIFAIIYPAIYPTIALIPLLVVTIALPYVTGTTLRRLILTCGLVVTIVVGLGEFVQILPTPPAQLTSLVRVVSLISVVGLVMLLLWQFSSRLTETLRDVQQANRVLQATQIDLQASLAVQATSLAEAAARAEAQAQLLDENESQRATIRDLSAPVIPLLPGVLVAPVVGTLDSARAAMLTSNILRTTERLHATYVILDVTGVPFVDIEVARALLQMAAATRLLGAQVLLAGVRPEVAQIMVALQVDLRVLTVCADLESAIETLLARRMHSRDDQLSMPQRDRRPPARGSFSR